MNNRLQKKCFIAATGFHLLLVGILLFGSAFFTSNAKTNNVNSGAPFEVISPTTIEALMTPPASPAPTSREQQIVRPPSSPSKERVRVAEHVRTPGDRTVSRREANTSAERLEAQRLQTLADAIQNVSRAIANGGSGSTEVELPVASNNGGANTSDFLNAIKRVYTDAWILPEDTSDDDGTVSASVTIAKDGSVVRYKVLKQSGNKAIDRSVQQTLDRVKKVEPLPADSKESERTVTIKFNAKVKRAGG